MIYAEGRPVFELVDAYGHPYVLQIRSEKFSEKDLDSLGETLQKLPEGRFYRTRVLDEELVLALSPHMTTYGTSDE